MARATTRRPKNLPAEHLTTRPGRQYQMGLQPKEFNPKYKSSGKLKDKVALITGGDSGIGRAIAVAFAREGADVAISYLNETKDAAKTRQLVEREGRQSLELAGDIGDKTICESLVKNTVEKFGKLDILINNAGEQHPQTKPEDISAEQLERTFRTNIFSMFYLTQAALKYLKKGGAIINTASVTAYKGHPILLDYSSTKGAIVSFTRSLSQMIAKRGIRVNAVAPGPIWTPLIPSTFEPEHVKNFGKDTTLGRPGQPEEVAPAYIYLASDDSSFVTGQTIHVNGGAIVSS
jgi:NAD(P)-dependent dehydrogenase (short-subunit alcohol dehydrogenase family)